jgi:hypothetical protein
MSVVSSGTPVSSTNKTDRHDITEYIVVSGINHHNPNLLCNGLMYLVMC